MDLQIDKGTVIFNFLNLTQLNIIDFLTSADLT